METRRTRRTERRHTRRIVIVLASTAALSLGFALALRRSTSASGALLALAIATLAAVGVRTPSTVRIQDALFPNTPIDAIDATLRDASLRRLLPARYVAIEPSPPMPRRVRAQHPRRTAIALTHTASRARDELHGTRHVWVLIALIYVFLALFALVVTLAVVRS